MIQRIQTLYLLAVALVSGIVPSVISACCSTEKTQSFLEDFTLTTLFTVAMLALISIFLFKNRKSQFVLNRINIICNLILLGVLAYQMLNSSGESLLSEKGVLVFVPIISIVFLFLANKAIFRDENLVKSADRLR